MNKYLVEFIGTFFFVLTIGLATIGGAGSFAPLAIGAMFMVMVFAGAHISGAHYNPAVTLGVWMRGKCTSANAVSYVVAQFAASALASVVVAYFNVGVVAAPAALSVMPSLLAEFLGSFALVYVVLNVTTSKSNAGNSFYGIAIGFTIFACAYCFGGISGGVFNPAAALGMALMGLKNTSDLWIYCTANFVGAAVATIAFKIIYEGDE